MLGESVIPDTQSHLQRGLTAGVRSPHMDIHDASMGDSRRNMPAVVLKTGHRVEGIFLDRCQLSFTKACCQMGSAGIFAIVRGSEQDEGKRERERVSIVLSWQSRSQLEQRERRWSLEKQNDTCLSKEGALQAG